MTAVWPRAIAFALMMPIGGWLPRLVLGGTVAWALTALTPTLPHLGITALIGESALGALFGVLAALPMHAGRGLAPRGPQSLAFAGHIWSTALFFALGGPILLLAGMAQSFSVSVDAIAHNGAQFFSALVLLGLPFWAVDLIIGPLAGVLQRVGNPTMAHTLLISRSTLGLMALVFCLPLALDILSDQWLATLVVQP